MHQNEYAVSRDIYDEPRKQAQCRAYTLRSNMCISGSSNTARRAKKQTWYPSRSVCCLPVAVAKKCTSFRLYIALWRELARHVELAY